MDVFTRKRRKTSFCSQTKAPFLLLTEEVTHGRRAPLNRGPDSRAAGTTQGLRLNQGSGGSRRMGFLALLRLPSHRGSSSSPGAHGPAQTHRLPMTTESTVLAALSSRLQRSLLRSRAKGGKPSTQHLPQDEAPKSGPGQLSEPSTDPYTPSWDKITLILIPEPQFQFKSCKGQLHLCWSLPSLWQPAPDVTFCFSPSS